MNQDMDLYISDSCMLDYLDNQSSRCILVDMWVDFLCNWVNKNKWLKCQLYDTLSKVHREKARRDLFQLVVLSKIEKNVLNIRSY